MAAKQSETKETLFKLRITESDREILRLAAKERGVTQSALVREALMSVGVPMAA
jgi:uncharacterized protein (DUF1778 family)